MSNAFFHAISSARALNSEFLRKIQQFSLTLPIQMVNTVKTKAVAGEYATENEVIKNGLRALMMRAAPCKIDCKSKLGQPMMH
ncbi:MAG: hypothetical protein Q8K12_05190 [Thiobacillus sp.]|nr:hypothetical protein [Thiobacillus sp.]